MIFNGLLSRFTRDVGVDLGTANTLVYVRHWQYFQENPPACSMAQVGRLRSGAAVEIEVVALS